ncbi:hypothetical protein [Sporosarcina aquimarina]|uniref:hypothetical protein n=1 Tax=Sporosarcina aquimarina TaxID=114975 RepID=UPI001C8D0466|nr:hypothetical protein [Sporosarcina aquimarina]MBY0224111.1 hypothetical protein [Sporosarcina aquimarina]
MGKNIKQIVSDLLNKVDKTSNNYETALEEKQETIIQLQLQMQDEQLKLKEYHKMAVLKEVSEATYEEQKKVVSSLQEKMASLQNEIQLISTYKTEDIDTILSNIDEVKPEFNQKYLGEIEVVKQEIADAKKAYLNRLSELGKQYEKAVSEESRYENFLVSMGKQPSSYLPDKVETIGGGAVVSADEVLKSL